MLIDNFNNKLVIVKSIDDFEIIANCIRNHSSVSIICDFNTKIHCLPRLEEILNYNNLLYSIIEIPEGEKSKNFDTSIIIIENLLTRACDRNSLIINLGGGVISDIGGFVASIYKRGINFINIPTTLLAMVDASVGGKTGIDHMGIKNVIGSFSNPQFTVIDSSFLNTLNKRELLNGFAEMLKHGLIADSGYWDEMISIDLNKISIDNIYKSILIKSTIVSADFKEKNVRKTLNFGHTLGHAIETLFMKSDSALKHGESIAIGIILESFLSYKLNLLNLDSLKQIQDAITSRYGKIPIDNLDFNSILKCLQNDKKNYNNNIQFSLLNSIGRAIYNCNISNDLIKESLVYYSSL